MFSTFPIPVYEMINIKTYGLSVGLLEVEAYTPPRDWKSYIFKYLITSKFWLTCLLCVLGDIDWIICYNNVHANLLKKVLIGGSVHWFAL